MSSSMASLQEDVSPVSHGICCTMQRPCAEGAHEWWCNRPARWLGVRQDHPCVRAMSDCNQCWTCRSLVLKACPGYAQTEVQLSKLSDGSMVVCHDKLCQPAHKAMCLAFALQAMSQKHMHSATASSLHRPISVHDAQAVQPSSDLAVAVVGTSLALLCDSSCHATLMTCLLMACLLMACLLMTCLYQTASVFGDDIAVVNWHNALQLLLHDMVKTHQEVLAVPALFALNLCFELVQGQSHTWMQHIQQTL